MVEALRNWFGHDSFREGQEEVVQRILAGEDLCVVMPTGAGKSLCYQLPMLMRPGYGLVVSPLISLMKDQVDALCRQGIAAAYVNSTVPPAIQSRILNDVRAGIVRILYVAPERFRVASFERLLRDCSPALFVVDEAHCISQWGHDFRTDYLRLGPIAEELSIAQVCAFTATATPRVRDDIRTHLRRDAMAVFITGFQRPNLSFHVEECSTEESKMAHLARLLSEPQPSIIYTATRKTAETVAADIDGICYHAGLHGDQRSIAQTRFMREERPVLVATNAFGMGIDRADIRRVIHYNLPGSVEAYYQEAGRAGRDGQPADCVLLYSYRDRFIQEFLIDLNNPSEALLRSVYATLLRECDRSGSTALELSNVELAALGSAAENEKAVGSALRILEKNGVVRRGYRRGVMGTLRITGDARALQQIHQHQRTQRSRFLYRVLTHLQGDPILQAGLPALAQIAGLTPDQTGRVLQALNGDVLEWTPPYTGRTLELVDAEARQLSMDFAATEEKKAVELGRLESMLAYTRTRECRQRALVGYFGQDISSWRCGCCDNCGAGSRPRPLSRKETTNAKAILAAVLSLEGRFGRRRIASMLGTPAQETTGSAALDEHPQRGILGHVGEDQVLEVLDALLRSDYVTVVGDSQYPCVDLSRRGLNVLDGKESLELALREGTKPPRKKKNRPSSPVKTRVEPADESLLKALRALRTRLAASKGVPAYRILGNATLAELAAQRPRTPAESVKLNGVGKVKSHTVIPVFLAEIRRWEDAGEGGT